MAEKAQNKSSQEQDVAGGTRPEKKGRGFAAMDEERQRAIASEGGRAAHEQGRAHEFTPEEAREAGRKGGQASGGARRGNKQAGQKQPKSTSPSRPEIEEEETERIMTSEEDETREDQT
jgi:uncharacterized protein